MRNCFGRFGTPVPSTEPPVVYRDDGGSGLLEACERRFALPEFEVGCDARRTVWVKRANGARSFGVSPWLLGRRSMSEVLEHLETRLAQPAG